MQTSQVPTLPTPPTPTVPAPSSIGKAISDAVNAGVSAGLTSAQIAVQQQLDEAIAQRNAIQASLDVAVSGPEHAKLARQLSTANRHVRDLQSAVDKLQAGLNRQNNPYTSGTNPPPPFPPNSAADDVPTVMIVSVMAIMFIGFPLSIAFARILLKRASGRVAPAPPQLGADATRRFDQLEQAVDSIAIEVERISENQRYLTKVLSEPRVTAGEPPKS